MPDKIFIDSNLWIYLFVESEDSKYKIKIVEKIILKNTPNVYISNQVLNEFSNVLYRKYKANTNDVRSYLKDILSIVQINNINKLNTFQALDLIDNYSISFYDALIASSALSNNCNVLYSEDMHHEQLIENKLTIINPFK